MEKRQKTHQEGFRATYDGVMRDPLYRRYSSDSDFCNFGYWQAGIRTQAEASENLVEKLLAYLPEKQGTILDVACGMGASTRTLLKYYPAEDVCAVNISVIQLAQTMRNAPGCAVVAMDAVSLAFRDASFDNVLCVEAAFHFRPRTSFYAEAFRVLKPGGRLVTSDILGPRWSDPINHETVRSLARQLESAGFRDVRVEDYVDECFGGFCRNIRHWLAKEHAAGRIGLGQYLTLGLAARLPWRLMVQHYPLTSARKPL